MLLNVGGTQFTTTVKTLMAVPNSFFTKMLGRFANDVKTQARLSLFVDRSPQVRVVLCVLGKRNHLAVV